jgi:hypothetical protein
MSFSFLQQFAGFGIHSPEGKGDTRQCYNCGVVGHIGRDCLTNASGGRGSGGQSNDAMPQPQAGAPAPQQMIMPP